MNDFVEKIKSVINVVEDICNQVEKNNNYNLVPELMNILETLIPEIFAVNNQIQIFDNEDIIEILEDIVNAFENKDSVLMTDVLRYGLNKNLSLFIEAINVKEGNSYE